MIKTNDMQPDHCGVNRRPASSFATFSEPRTKAASDRPYSISIVARETLLAFERHGQNRPNHRHPSSGVPGLEAVNDRRRVRTSELRMPVQTFQGFQSRGQCGHSPPTFRCSASEADSCPSESKPECRTWVAARSRPQWRTQRMGRNGLGTDGAHRVWMSRSQQ
jgi:hypothetical protein